MNTNKPLLLFLPWVPLQYPMNTILLLLLRISPLCGGVICDRDIQPATRISPLCGGADLVSVSYLYIDSYRVSAGPNIELANAQEL